MQLNLYWRPVEITVPLPLEDVLVVNRLGNLDDEPMVDMAFRRKSGEWVLSSSDPLTVIRPTHWMPLPSLPAGCLANNEG